MFGIVLKEGRGGTQDLARAAMMFKKAADKGQPDARTRFGMCLEKGDGVTPDPARAAEMFRVAATKTSCSSVRIPMMPPKRDRSAEKPEEGGRLL
jgi:TPR repeat protein